MDGKIKITSELILSEIALLEESLNDLNEGINVYVEKIYNNLCNNKSGFLDEMLELMQDLSYLELYAMSGDISEFNTSVNDAINGFIEMDSNIISNDSGENEEAIA